MTTTVEKTTFFATCEKVLLKDLIEGITQHASKAEQQNILSCVHVISKEDRLQFVAIDGNVLAILNLPVDLHEPPSEEIIVNIPAQSLKILLPLLKSKGDSDFMHIKLTNESLTIEDPITESSLTISQFMEGTYPKYEQLIPDIKDEKFRKFALNSQYLKQVSKTLNSPHTSGLIFYQSGPTDCVLMKRMDIKHPLSTEDLVLLMPLQTDDTETAA